MKGRGGSPLSVWCKTAHDRNRIRNEFPYFGAPRRRKNRRMSYRGTHVVVIEIWKVAGGMGGGMSTATIIGIRTERTLSRNCPCTID
jgi:hypothetical protein